MKLVYVATKELVKIGDAVMLDGSSVTVDFFREPHSPASSGKVSVKFNDGFTREYYVGVIGAEWIEREDR